MRLPSPRLAAAGLAVLGGLIAASPAHALIAYEKRTTSSRPQIWVANDDGTAARMLAGNGKGGDQPVIAPDGSAVMFDTRAARSNPAVGLVPTAGGPIRILAHNVAGSTVWSPDSKTIAMVLQKGLEHNRLVLANVATGATRTVATGDITGVSFSPDSTQVAYDRAPSDRAIVPRSDIYAAPVAGGPARRLTTNHASVVPIWGPTQIAFARVTKPRHRDDYPKSNIWVMNPDGSGQRQLTHQKSPMFQEGPFPLDWSADGTRLLVTVGGQDTDYGEGVDVATGAIHRFSTKRDFAYGFVVSGLSADGTTVIGDTGGFDPGGQHEVDTVPWGGGTPTVLVKHAFSPSWTK